MAHPKLNIDSYSVMKSEREMAESFPPATADKVSGCFKNMMGDSYVKSDHRKEMALLIAQIRGE